MPELGDEADAPIIVPPPGQILRRAARTKIRKPGLPGDGAGHRFGSSRRIRRSSTDGRRTSGELSSSENGELEAPSPRRQTLSDDGFPNQRPDSFSEEASIFDAYVRDDEDDGFTPPTPELPPTAAPRLVDQPKLGTPEIQPSLLEALAPVLQQPDPIGVPQPSNEISAPSPRTPSPTIEPPAQQSPQPVSPYPQQSQQPSSPQPIISPEGPHILAPVPQHATRKEKEKDKKGLFGKWGGDKGGKKGKAAAAEKEKEKEGFFGSLFGGKKKQDDATPVVSSAGRETAQALLGASKSSKNHVPPPVSPGLAPGSPNFARYPIHVERAIYRLSHIKLANPRRPLYEQVLISNLMFWYLGVINKAQAATQSSDSQTAEKEAQEKEQKDKEAKEKAEKEKLEKEQKEKELEAKKRESPKRGSLTKTPAGGASPGRRAEMPIKGPQYEMQQQVMQKEYNGFNGQGPPGRPPMQNGPNGQPYPSPPRGPGSPQPQQFPQHQQQYHPPPPQGQMYPSQGQPYQQPYPPAPGQQYPNHGPPRGPPQGRPQGPDHFYYQSNENGPPRGGLPPGAMPPMGGPGVPPPHMQQPMNPNIPPRQGPPPNFQPQAQGRPPYPMGSGPENGPPPPGQGRVPSRSLSANAVPPNHPPPINGTLRKGNSAHAVAPYDPNRRPRTAEGKGRPSEEEDMPLAVYQQQHRK
jgi:hypothetical protein